MGKLDVGECLACKQVVSLTVDHITPGKEAIQWLCRGCNSSKRGRTIDFSKVDLVSLQKTCKRCDYVWLPSTEDKPKVCPRCKSYYWTEPLKRKRDTKS